MSAIISGSANVAQMIFEGFERLIADLTLLERTNMLFGERSHCSGVRTEDEKILHRDLLIIR